MTGADETTRDRLLREARDLYLDKGFAGFSLREVARRTGVSATAVYRHFDSKEALLEEVCAAGFRIFSGYLIRALDGRTPRDRMVRSSALYLQFAIENPRDYRVIFMGAADDHARAASGKPKGRENSATFQFLVDRVRECMQVGDIARGDPEQTATMIWANVHGLASLRISGHLSWGMNDEQFAKFYKRATELFLDGLAP
jgi:AcrR family transcriptional regulator